jgi:hypothetical protein
MPGSADRPLLFLDVDGPLIPFGAPQLHPGGHSGNRTAPQLLPAGSNPLLARLDPQHGLRLSALACDLVWATTWMADANEVIGPLLGLPELPLFGQRRNEDHEDFSKRFQSALTMLGAPWCLHRVPSRL